MTKFTKYKNCLLILIFVSVFTYVTNDEFDKIEVLPEDYDKFDLNFKIIVIGNSGKLI